MKPLARIFIALALLAAPLAAEAQPAGKVYRVGLLTPGAPSPSAVPSLGAFLKELRGHGWAEGQIVVERREGRRLHRWVQVARSAIAAVPIVMVMPGDTGTTDRLRSQAHSGQYL